MRRKTNEMHALLGNPLLSSQDKIVFQVIKSYANNKTGIAYPSQKTLSANTGMTDRSIRRSLQRLKDIGIIEVIKVKKNNHYTVNSSLEIWKSDTIEEMQEAIRLHKLNKNKPTQAKKPAKKVKNTFKNFEERKQDYAAIERQAIKNINSCKKKESQRPNKDSFNNLDNNNISSAQI